MSRIVVETEPDWLRVKDNVSQGMNTSLEARLSSLPGGKDGDIARQIRGEVEARLRKVCGSSLRSLKSESDC